MILYIRHCALAITLPFCFLNNKIPQSKYMVSSFNFITQEFNKVIPTKLVLNTL